ncbi:MAG: nickel pincer cofactor biosynthesis protein LarB [Cenarchaeum sp. SB0678_bin_8]|nr:nickel pincer cofactor biosynthesis protein LarB [Cenarchaeum sp. SB0664_bin_35]MXZ93579.1 nickel pincer cofactor biosynthesis protein LarB [Cenarchaeum sp. SB0666_bin_15]MYB46263.1 nickel pincer cofactor biosynthesis protein LarB [Cenarchaeum sp. SB0662_bin_33]MYD58469.1 nickel pincer cofactor biosynthesis protein LarB [Cenarchaeum sp. SB0678_bin_8]MYJ27322.1 nickel pincer cofactor biosynthesis protein LarB [Cenarchaeum sp. SB0672_bin_9]
MELDEILRSLELHKIDSAQARKMLSLYSIEKLENLVRLDVGRAHRRRVPEVILAESKQLSDIKLIIERHTLNSLMISRIKSDVIDEVISFSKSLGYDMDTGQNCSSILLWRKPLTPTSGLVGILTAGTSDIPIAEEARLACKAMQCDTICEYDVGVAGLHRVFPALKEMIKAEADCIVVAAGMEGTLSTLVASLVDIPVIGVPVSVGYGYGSGGTAALSSMLQSCALGLTVVNIDGGVAAGAAAAKIAKHRICKAD